MKPVYAITSNTEISYGETLAFWGIKYTYWKIIELVLRNYKHGRTPTMHKSSLDCCLPS
jgi:hypothetical protein